MSPESPLYDDLNAYLHDCRNLSTTALFVRVRKIADKLRVGRWQSVDDVAQSVESVWEILESRHNGALPDEMRHLLNAVLHVEFFRYNSLQYTKVLNDILDHNRTIRDTARDVLPSRGPVKLNFDGEIEKSHSVPQHKLLIDTVNLDDERFLLSPLTTALDALLEIFDEEGSWKISLSNCRLNAMDFAIEAVQLLVHISLCFQLHRMYHDALVPAKLAYTLASSMEPFPVRPLGATVTGYLMCLLPARLYDTAIQVLDGIPEFIRRDLNWQELYPLEHTLLLAQGAWFTLLKKQAVHLGQALDAIKIRATSPIPQEGDSCLIKAIYLRLIANLCHLFPSLDSDDKKCLAKFLPQNVSPFWLLDEAKNQISIQYSEGSSGGWAGLARLYRKIEHFDIIENISKLYLAVGAPGEANAYVTYGLALAKREFSCRWILVFLDLQARCYHHNETSKYYQKFQTAVLEMDRIILGENIPVASILKQRISTSGNCSQTAQVDDLAEALGRIAVTENSNHIKPVEDISMQSSQNEDEEWAMAKHVAKFPPLDHPHKKEQLCNCKLCIDLDLHGALMKTIFLRFSALKGAKTRETMLKRACETYNVLNRRRIVLLPFTYTPKNASDLSKSASDQIAGPLEVPFFRIRFNHVAYSYLAFRPSSTFQEALDKLTEKFSDFAIIYPDVVAQSGYLHVLHTILKEVLKTGRTSAEGAKDLKDTLYSLSGWESSPTSSETSTNQGIINDALTSAVSGSMKFTGPATPERKPKNAAALIMEKRKVDGAGNKESRHRRRVVADDEPAIPSDLAQQAEEGKRMIANRRMTMLRDTVHLAEKTEVSISYSLPMVPSHSLQQGTIQHILDLLDYQISQMVDFPLFPYFRKCALLRLLFSESSCTADNLAKYSAAGIGQKTQSLSHQRSTSYGKMSISFDNLDSRCTLTKQDIDEWNPISRLPTVMTDSLPENWVVCAISLVTKETLPLFGASPSDVLYIVVTRWEKGLPAITMRIPVRSKTNKTVESLQEIHKKANRNQLHHAGARDYWNTRLQLNDDVAQVTESMENNLGYARALFLTAPADKTVDEALKGRMRSLRSLATKNSIEFNAPFVRLIALAGLYLSKNELEKFAVDLFGYDKEREWEVKTIVKFVLNKPVVTGSDICYERHPVVLIPDNNAFNLPWESMPILRNHPVSRMPSVATLNSHLDRYRRVLNTDNGFYILNPTADLMEMQKRFEKFFENERLNTWEGVSGKVPSKETIAAALSQRELIVYMGHGSGDGIFSSHLYSARDISANMFLIGCSSVRLQHGPMMDGTAFFNRCLMTGSRCILGNLWMVTSGCIDSMMSSLLTDLLSVSDKAEEKKGEKWFQALLAICRERTRSNFLVGAAPVVIGLPMVY